MIVIVNNSFGIKLNLVHLTDTTYFEADDSEYQTMVFQFPKLELHRKLTDEELTRLSYT